MVKKLQILAAASVFSCGAAYASAWTPISETNAVTPSDNNPGVMAAVAFVGPNPDQFLPYFAVLDSALCGGKKQDPIAAIVGPTSLSLIRGPKVSSVTKCIGDTSITSPETLAGIKLVSGYFITGRIALLGIDGKSQTGFSTGDVMKYLVSVMTARQRRGI